MVGEASSATGGGDDNTNEGIQMGGWGQFCGEIDLIWPGPSVDRPPQWCSLRCRIRPSNMAVEVVLWRFLATDTIPPLGSCVG